MAGKHLTDKASLEVSSITAKQVAHLSAACFETRITVPYIPNKIYMLYRAFYCAGQGRDGRAGLELYVEA